MSIEFKELKKRKDALRSNRSAWDPRFQELRELIHPHASDFNRKAAKGQLRTEQIFEGTAPYACELFASGLGAFGTPKSDRWFTLSVQDYDMKRDRAAQEYLEYLTDRIMYEYALPSVGFYDSTHECYLELGSIGTTVMNQEWSHHRGHIQFKCIPLANVWIDEDADGRIDTVFREVSWTKRQIVQHFNKEGDQLPKKIDECKKEDKVWTITQAVFPRTDRDASKLTATNKQFASIWFCEEAHDSTSEGILRNHGYDEFPFHVPRWSKKSGEVYGRSPGWTCLPDIRLINTMEKTQIRSAQKQADPPLLVPSDGFMLPIRTSPSSLNFFEPGLANNEMIKPLETRGRYDIGEDKMSQKRDHIMRCFYADWIQRQKKKERQSAYEVQDDREEMLNLMGPNMSRLENEFYSPTLFRTYTLLRDNGQLLTPPPSLTGRELKVVYTSPSVKAQQARKGIANRRWLAEELIPMAQVDPSALDILDTDAYLQESAEYGGVSRRIFKSPEEVAAKREAASEQQQMQQMAETAQPASEALKNVAQAKEMGMGL